MRNHLPENLKWLRKDRGWTCENAAEELNMKRSTLSSWENGATEPSVQAIIKICELYYITPSDLILEDIGSWKMSRWRAYKMHRMELEVERLRKEVTS